MDISDSNGKTVVLRRRLAIVEVRRLRNMKHELTAMGIKAVSHQLAAKGSEP